MSEEQLKGLIFLPFVGNSEEVSPALATYKVSDAVPSVL
jgi:hypothetical protein